MTKVDMEKALDFLRLQELGRSYVDIAEENGLDDKTVAYWVVKAKDFIKNQHRHEIGEDLDTRNMQEHHQMLLVTALGISRAVATPPQIVGPGQLADILVSHYVLTGLEELKQFLDGQGTVARSNELGGMHSNDWYLRKRTAARLLNGLFQHIPELQGAVEQWASEWQRFQYEKDELVKEITGALVEDGRDSNVADHLASKAVRKALERKIGDWLEEDLPDPSLDFAVDQVKPNWDAAFDALTRVQASVTTCRGFLEYVLLRGGPPGVCHLCPSS